MVTGQAAVNMTAEAAVCPLRLEPPNTTTLILTYADGDVCGPLIVVLAGDCSLADQLKAKLTLKPQDPSIREVLPFSNAIERSARVSTALFVDFWKENKSQTERFLTFANSINWKYLEIKYRIPFSSVYLSQTHKIYIRKKKNSGETFPAAH